MTLHKDVTFRGITLEYHELVIINQDYRNIKTYARMYSYINKAAWEANPDNWFCYFEFDFDDTYNNIAQVKTAIKALDEWSSATDE